ncbi:hypothetical protein GWI33_013580 [Rhynchophorus ferrugineus]|uniref:C2H2-type domain-containing protein n=1 Tax=Rhynchophorus ferrugineus TaxID=354439 RepID=A0A834I6S1_RHYFE|nr:hypothetical protein GWI33_013580 [Rhynchophorus ferrugineus]
MENINETNIFDMLDKNNNVYHYTKKILNCFPNLKLYEYFPLPKLICIECLNSLIESYNLFMKVQTSQRILQKYTHRKQGKSNFLSNKVNNNPEIQSITKQSGLISDIESDNSDSVSNVSDYVKHSHKTKSQIKGSFKRCSKEFATRATTLKKHVCVKCNKRYKSQFELQVHLRKHNGDKPFSCSLCEKSFSDKRNLRKHEKIHTGKKNHECPTCRKTFLHVYTLKTHERLHTGEKLYVCDTCGCSFNTSSQLTIHIRTHTKEKPYGCTFCSNTFVSKAALNSHVIVHTGEKRFNCTICGRKCRSGYDLKTHVRIHTNEKPYQCNYPSCEKRYKTSSQLSVHFRTHTGEKPHKCVVCLKQFGETTSLKRHMITHEKCKENKT